MSEDKEPNVFTDQVKPKEEIKPKVKEEVKEKPKPVATKAPVADNKIIIKLDGPIEIINLTNSQRHSIMPKPPKKVKLINTNLYRLPITNKELNIDKAYAIKQYSKYAEYFQILSVINGVVSIMPIVGGFELNHNDQIGELI